MLKAQKGKSIFLQLFDISQQIAISSLQGYFSAAENIESQDGLKIWNIQKLNILPRSIEHRTEHGLNILSTADVVMKCQLWFFCCPLNWVQNLLSDGWSSLEQGYSIAIQMHPDHEKYWLKRNVSSILRVFDRKSRRQAHKDLRLVLGWDING